MFCALGAFVLLGAAGLSYPPAPKSVTFDIYAGSVRVTDPYRWLEKDSDPRVEAWAAAETRYADRFVHRQPTYAAFARRITALAHTSTARFGLTIAGGHWIYQRRTPPQPQPQLVTRDGLGGAERVLYDPASDANGRPQPAIESVFVSPDGSKVAFTTQEGGAEEETLHVIDVADGKTLSDEIPHAGGGTSPSAVAWDADAKGFLYARWPKDVPPSEAHFNIALYHHTLGEDPTGDQYVFGHGLARAAEYTFAAARDGSRVAAFVSAGDVPDHAVYVRDGNGPFVQIASAADRVKDGTFVAHTLLLRTSKRHPHYDVVAVDPGADFGRGRVFIRAGNTVIDAVTSAAGYVLTSDQAGGESELRAFTAAGKAPGRVPLPQHLALTELAGDEIGSEIVAGYASYGTPGTWVRLLPSASGLAVRATGIVTKAPGDYSRLVVKRVFVRSLDGAANIPLTYVMLPRVRRDAPTVLTAYGSYGLISTPRFLGSWLNWLEHGGVWAQANIRGGGEYGETWHTAAWHEHVTKRADDLAACARWLIGHGYGSGNRLGIAGGSAGGYLMGMALTRNPRLYRAVAASVGIYDALRTELSPNGFFNIPEFGTVKDARQFRWMLAASPYHHVQDGVAYPAVLMQTGANDPRVEPMQSRKMVARLQAASSSGYPVLLIQRAGQGHGIGSSFAQRNAGVIEQQVFFASQLMAGRQ